MSDRGTLFVALLSSVSATGCIASTHRYVDTESSPEEAVATIARAAQARGLSATSDGQWIEVRDPKVEGGFRGAFRVARLEHGGARIETTGSRDEVDEIIADAYGPPALVFETASADSVGWSSDAQLEYALSLGAAGVAGQDPSWRVEGTVRAGPRLLRIGGGGDRAEPSTGLLLLGGLGFSGISSEAWFRPELVLALDHQKLAEPIAGRLLPTGRRYVLDLSVAALVGLDHGHHGAEIGLSLRDGSWGGVFARVGLVDVDGARFVWTVGASLGTVPSLYVTALTLIVGALVGAAAAGASEGVMDVLGGG